MTEQELKIVTAMSELGGSFVKALALCFFKADAINFKKLNNPIAKFKLKQNVLGYSPTNITYQEMNVNCIINVFPNRTTSCNINIQI